MIGDVPPNLSPRFVYSPVPPLQEGSSPVLSRFYKKFHNTFRHPQNLLPANMLSPFPSGTVLPASTLPHQKNNRMVNYF